MKKKSTKLMKLLCTIICACSMYMANATVHYVKTTSAGLANGSSWANASDDLQAMINIAIAGDSIWVGTGTYVPNADLFGNTMPTSNRFKCFGLKDGVQLFGGFAGTETNFTQRQIATNITTLSGDINGDDIVVPVANTVYATNTNIADNAYHITMYAKGTSAGLGITIDGFTFSGAAANVATLQFYNGEIIQADKGGAISLYKGTHIIRNNNFVHNTTSTFASAIFLIQTSNVLIENNSFTQNNSEFGTINSSVDTNLIMNGNTFIANTGINGPGVLSGDGSSIGMMDNIFLQNKGAIGAMQLAECTVSGQNNLFIKNHGTQNVGAIQSSGGASSFYFTHCTFFNNTSTTSVKTFSANFDAYATLTNCIIQGNGQQLSKCSNCVLDLSASIIAGGDSTCVACPNLIGNVYPQFIDTTNFIGADNTWRTADDGLNLLITSPANGISIYNSYTNSQDIKGSTRPLGNGSIGVYQYACSVQKVFVKPNASGNNSGTSWANAFTDFQSALNTCADTIWVTGGTYKPSLDANGLPGFDPKDNTFSIPDGKKIFGGFNGTETLLSERNIYINITKLSADVNGDDAVSGATGNLISLNNKGDNNYHAVVILGPIANSLGVVLDGFTIVCGKANSGTTFNAANGTIDNGAGSGLYIKNGNSSISNCKIIGGDANVGGGVYVNGTVHNFLNDSLINNYGFVGGGIYAVNSLLSIKRCTAIANNSQYGGAIKSVNTTNFIDSCYFASNGDAFQGGALNLEGNDQAITKCTFVNNAGRGGAIFATNAGAYIHTNIFKGNYSPYNGAAVYLNNGGHDIQDNFFELNYATESGGGIYLADTANVATIRNNVFASNDANLSGGGIHVGAGVSANILHNTFYDNYCFYPSGGFYSAASSIIDLENNIFWRNRDVNGIPVAQFQNNATNSIATNNIATTSAAPLNGNPNFINQADVNGADNIYFTADDGLNILPTSIAVNTGANITTLWHPRDIIGTDRNYQTPCIGAYEYAAPTFLFEGTAGVLECSTDTTHVSFTIANATGTVIIAPSATGLSAGIYTFTATDANNITASTIVEINPANVFTMQAIQTQFQNCFGDSITLSANISAGVNNVSFTWLGDNIYPIHNRPFNYFSYNHFTVIAQNVRGTCIAYDSINNVFAINPQLVLASGASSTSFANGYGAAALNIPMQDGESITFKNQFAITNCDIIATVQDSVGGNILGNVDAVSIINTDSVITNNTMHYVKRPIHITPTSNGAAIVTLYFTPTELAQYNEYVNNNNATNLAFSISNFTPNNGDSFAAYITKVQGAAIDSGGTINAIIPVSVKYNSDWEMWSCTFSVMNFSYFYLSGATNTVPLSVNEIKLQAIINGNTDNLNFQMQPGNSFEKLELQQSTDGKTFNTINSTTTLGKTQFSFTNTNTFALINYYKVKGFSTNNKIAYSTIVSTNRTINNNVQTYPNPMLDNGVLEINCIKNTQGIIKIYNTLGAIVYTISTNLEKGKNTISIPAQELASGLYYIKINIGNNSLLHSSFIKK